MVLYVGCAGWSIARRVAEHFPGAGSHLERYAARFNAVEINSSFYRPHQQKTYARWAAATPRGFRFSVKAPKQITHQARLVDATEALDRFVEEVSGLGEKLGALLVQLPPSLAFDGDLAEGFFRELRQRLPEVAVALEPRHPSWFAADVDSLLTSLAISRVAADPPPVPSASRPAGAQRTVYYRLHGSPRMYYSAYESEFLREVAQQLALSLRADAATWCIFDNTALSAASENALELLGCLGSQQV